MTVANLKGQARRFTPFTQKSFFLYMSPRSATLPNIFISRGSWRFTNTTTPIIPNFSIFRRRRRRRGPIEFQYKSLTLLAFHWRKAICIARWKSVWVKVYYIVCVLRMNEQTENVTVSADGAFLGMINVTRPCQVYLGITDWRKNIVFVRFISLLSYL